MFRKINIGRLARWMPNSLLETRVACDHVMLTFDDGPEPEILPSLLEVLAEFNVKATFFSLGYWLEKYPELGKSIVASGHRLANHSFMHQGFYRLSLAEQWDEIIRTEELIRAAGDSGKLFRPPQGRIDPVLAFKLKQNGFRITHWNIDSCDYSRNIDTINKSLGAVQIKPGDIILMHDDTLLSCEILRQWLPRWLDQGLRFDKM